MPPCRSGTSSPSVLSCRRAADQSAHFSGVLERMLGRLAAEQAKAREPAELAEVVWTALTVARPKAAYRVHQDRQRAALDLLPTRMADAVLKRVLAAR